MMPSWPDGEGPAAGADHSGLCISTASIQMLPINVALDLTDLLRERGESLLEGIMDEDEKLHVRMQVEKSIAALDAHTGMIPAEGHVWHDQKLTSSAVVQNLLVASRLHNRGALSNVLTDALSLLFPNISAEDFQRLSGGRAKGNVPAQSTTRRSQLTIDAAWCALTRSSLMSSSGPLWIWCDSSPQAGEDPKC